MHVRTEPCQEKRTASGFLLDRGDSRLSNSQVKAMTLALQANWLVEGGPR